MEKEISHRVIKAIEDSGLTDDEIAPLVGVSKSTVWRWRVGETTSFSPNKLKSIAKALQTDYEWLRFGKTQKSNNDSVNSSGEEYLTEEEQILLRIIRGDTDVELPLDLIPKAVRLRDSIDRKVEETVKKK